MKVILVQAPVRNLRFNIGAYFKILPLGIAYLAKVLQDSKIDFEIFYPRESGDILLKLKGYLEKHKDSPAIIGISATLFSARESFKIARIAKSINSRNVIVLGGPVTLISPRSIFNYSGDINYVVSGEGERSFVDLVLALNNNRAISSVSNISYRINNEVISRREEFENNLDSLGFPLREAFPRWLHTLHPPMGRYTPGYLVETIRGCSFKCKFCSLSGDMRMRSVDFVIEELLMLERTFGAKEVYFTDPTFTISRERIDQLCRRMIDKEINLKWTCQTRVDCVDRELLKIMKASGCYMIHFGVESAIANILDGVQKEQTVEDIITAFDGCNKEGIKTGAFMILASTAHDNDASLRESMKLVRKIRPSYVLYDHIKPIPGSPLVQNAKERGAITEEDIEQFYLGDQEKSKLSRLTVSGIPRKTAERWVFKASRSFYLSPGAIIRILQGLKTGNDWLNVLRGGCIYFRELLRKNEW